jgi:hypothetical protein
MFMIKAYKTPIILDKISQQNYDSIVNQMKRETLWKIKFIKKILQPS